MCVQLYIYCGSALSPFHNKGTIFTWKACFWLYKGWNSSEQNIRKYSTTLFWNVREYPRSLWNVLEHFRMLWNVLEQRGFFVWVRISHW